MTKALLIFPHQLFAEHPSLTEAPERVVLIEDPLFFGDRQYPMRFHKQKLWLHRASMARYAQRLADQGLSVDTVRYDPEVAVLKTTVERLAGQGVKTLITCDPVDFSLEKRLNTYAQANELDLDLLPTPSFLNTQTQNRLWREDQKRWFMAEFYKSQRRRLNILMEGDGPVGGRWSFDEDNRKKVPKKLQAQVPQLWPLQEVDEIDQQARTSVLEDFPDNYGNLENLFWPTDHEAAAVWLTRFLSERFELFGPYEDAILKGESLLWHSAITPMLNIGLLTPKQVVTATLEHMEASEIPLNSAEGFLRQIIGWREFMRATYQDLGVRMRTTNHWNQKRKMPERFWTGETGIAPLDDTIKRVLETGYCHHIERLMVLGGFMFLCEFDPDDIYRWFMEMFVDAYDWVMVTNVYAMSQNADGGLITTKPYFSGSAYVKKMGNHPKGEWCDIWDGLYWRWIWTHAEALEKNPRWAMMVSMVRKMDPGKRDTHLARANAYLDSLDA
ncbi:MAG: cryptochrome/photolyase family protein [Henriciella sp.]|nr:cryptochrome/photolyase family protein [Henriciella sp.]